MARILKVVLCGSRRIWRGLAVLGDSPPQYPDPDEEDADLQAVFRRHCLPDFDGFVTSSAAGMATRPGRPCRGVTCTRWNGVPFTAHLAQRTYSVRYKSMSRLAPSSPS